MKRGWYKIKKGHLYGCTLLYLDEKGLISAYSSHGGYIMVDSTLNYWGKRLMDNMTPLTKEEIFLEMI